MLRHLIPRACLFVTLFAAAPMPAAAQQACPRSPEALDNGVLARFTDFTIRFTRRPDGRIYEVEQFPDEDLVVHYVSDPIGAAFEIWETTRAGVVDEASRDRFTYAFAMGFPQPEPSSRWSGVETQETAAGERYKTRTIWDMGPQEMVKIGDCLYSSIEIIETRIDFAAAPDDPPWINHYTYLPELGMSFFRGGDERGITPVLETPYALVSIAP